jgi:GNAT superfamily N-acetyltransferase
MDTSRYRLAYLTEPDPQRDDVVYTDHIVEAFCGTELVGYLAAFSRTADPDWVQIAGLAVHPDHRRKGIETALVDELALREPDRIIRHGGRTKDGQAWWRAYRRRPGLQRGRHVDGYRDPDLDGYEWRDAVQARTERTRDPQGAAPSGLGSRR